MVRNPIHIWFDFIDPASFLLMMEIEAAYLDGDSWTHRAQMNWQPLERRPPPTPLTGIDDPRIAPLWEDAGRLAVDAGVDLCPPVLVPWTRKAHELVAHAEAQNSTTAHAVRLAIARCYAQDGGDIGRVDVLMEIGREHGLDRTETKAVLDVDRYEAQVAAMGHQAAEGRRARRGRGRGRGSRPGRCRDGSGCGCSSWCGK